MDNASHTKSKVLLVEDDASLAQWMLDYLSAYEFELSHAADGKDAVTMIKNDPPDLVILDVMLPNLDGYGVCERVRPFFNNPILMLTACSEDQDEIKGLEVGANDFVAKPVRPRVLLARIQSLLRRQNSSAGQSLQFGNLSLNFGAKSVSIRDEKIELSSTEFDVLWALAKNAGTIVSRKTLLNNLRGIDYDGFDRSVDITISRLRKKLRDTNSQDQKIKTVRAKGYLFSAQDWND